MFNLLKRKNAKKEENIKADIEKHKRDFINYINAYYGQNSTIDSIYILFNNLDPNIKLLIDKYDLEVDYGFQDEYDYLEFSIYSNDKKKAYLYIELKTYEGINTLILQDGKELNADNFTTNQIIEKITHEIENYFI